MGIPFVTVGPFTEDALIVRCGLCGRIGVYAHGPAAYFAADTHNSLHRAAA